MDASELELIARCAGGFEQVLAQELRGLGIRRVRPLKGSVAFFGTQRDAYRACLWSRVATRIQLVLARVSAVDADDLYQNAVAFPWEKHIRDGAAIALDAHGTSATLRNTQFTALKVKDALCDRLRNVRGSRPDVDPKHPDCRIGVSLHGQRATLYFDLSGESLHRRGYRTDGVQTEAPLKETLAAGILMMAGWPEMAAHGAVLVDPMCGSGTFAVEAALIAAGIAPGVLRTHWGFNGWVRHDRQLWDELLAKARERAAVPTSVPCVIAGDIDADAVAIARRNFEHAGVSSLVRLYVDDAACLSRHLRGVHSSRGLLVTNPPYGMRLSSQAELPQIHTALAEAVRALPVGWKAAFVTPDLGIDTALGRLPYHITACYNGPIEAWVRLYDITAENVQTCEVISLAGKQRSVPVADLLSSQFAARLRKVGKTQARWARREGVSCYRVYDSDLPDYPVSVDLFHGAAAEEGQLFLVVEERARPRSVDIQRAGRHFADAVALAAAILDVPIENVIQKPWVSDALYARMQNTANEQRFVHVGEGGYVVHADLMGALGEGLPLDQRNVRTFVTQHMRGVRFANLFAAADLATLFAAGAGAKRTVTVDVSKERLAWLESILKDNGFDTGAHRVKCADVRTWLASEAQAHRTYDVLLCVPPSSLTARGSWGQSWDIARDLPGLLKDMRRVLAKDGMIVLGLPVGSPELSSDVLVRCGLLAKDVSADMVPHDVSRSRSLGRYYVLTLGT